MYSKTFRSKRADLVFQHFVGNHVAMTEFGAVGGLVHLYPVSRDQLPGFVLLHYFTCTIVTQLDRIVRVCADRENNETTWKGTVL